MKRILKNVGILPVAVLLAIISLVLNNNSLSLYVDVNRNMASASTKMFNATFPTRANSAGEYKVFDPSQITHVYRLGHMKQYGRFNNQFVTILHAIDPEPTPSLVDGSVTLPTVTDTELAAQNASTVSRMMDSISRPDSRNDGS